MDQVCFDRVLPARLRPRGREVAVCENPANRASPFEAAALNSNLWLNGRTLRVTFMDGVPQVQAEVVRHARRWSRHANITYDFGNHAQAEIRISFQEAGSWSAIGTDALVEEYFPRDEPTMNFGWLTPASTEREYSRVVLHEFGHSLGMIHEHQNPAAGINWNRQAVSTALAGPPNNWDQATIDHNMFETYDRTITQFTAFDPDSIMVYAVPASWTLDGNAFEANEQLSPSDKAFIAARYPRARSA